MSLGLAFLSEGCVNSLTPGYLAARRAAQIAFILADKLALPAGVILLLNCGAAGEVAAALRNLAQRARAAAEMRARPAGLRARLGDVGAALVAPAPLILAQRARAAAAILALARGLMVRFRGRVGAVAGANAAGASRS